MSVKDNSQATAADHRARRTRRVREKKAASKWLARHSDPPPAFEEGEQGEQEKDSGVTETPTLPPVFNSGAPNALDASMPEEELAAKLEAPTVRPPSNPPTEEVRQEKEAEKEEEKSDEEVVAKTEEIPEVDNSREVDTVPPLRRLEEEPIDERVSGLPPKRSARFFVFAILVCATAFAIFGIRKLQHRAPKPQVTQATPPPPEPKAAPPVVATTKPADPAPTIPTGNAIEEREEARKLLEKRKMTEALPHAQRAVEIDPSDAQTWLILGATYQDLGKGVEARDTFLACTKTATAGPIHECRALLSYNGPR